MNDTDLDELLNAWSAPQPPASLRESVRAGFAAGLERPAPPHAQPRRIAAFARKILLAAAMLCTGAFLLLLATQAFPQTPPGRIPYTVNSEFLRYADDGSSTVEMYSTSYNNEQDNEVILSRSMPGNPLGTALGRSLDRALPLLSELTSPLTISPEESQKIKAMRAARPSVGFVSECEAGCLMVHHWNFWRDAAGVSGGCLSGPAVDRETILNHPTTAVALRLGDWGRMTVWTAPDLGCFALRITTEVQRRDGAFRLVNRKQALKITVNPQHRRPTASSPSDTREKARLNRDA